jgi:diguanylate cyclase
MRLLPRATELPVPERRALGVTVAVLWLATLAAALHTFFGLGGDGADQIVRDWVSSFVYVLAGMICCWRVLRVGSDRGPWLLIAVGVTLYGFGNLLWALWLEHVEEPPIPSACDALWLSLYPLVYVGVVWLARGGAKRAGAGVWLDGIVAGLGISAVGAAIVFQHMLETATGDTLAVVTELAYPIFDLLLAALVMGILALRGWRLDRLWGMLGIGFVVLSVADSIYMLQVASGTSDSSTLANVFYLSGVGLVAMSAWQPRQPAKAARLDGWSVLLVPAFFVFAALGLMIYDHVDAVDWLAFGLALATVAVAIVRTTFTFRDVRALAHARKQAITDDLTALPNRRLFMAQLDEAIRAARIKDQSMALMIVDLDHFKELNDTLGHAAGDMLLRQIGPRLEGAVRGGDVVARLGGDEFALLLEAPADAAAALAVTSKIRAAIAEPFEVRGLSLQIAASVGIALFPEHGSGADELLQRADVAMYQAKAARSGGELYAADRDVHSRERLALGGELRRAIEEDELELHYQPKVTTGPRAIAGVEALVRWRHPERGLLGPMEFVSVAEQTGQARALTSWVLRTGLAELREWRAGGTPDLHLAVNLTVADLLDAALPDAIEAALASHGVPAEALIVEVTETSVLADPVRVGAVLGRLDALGVGVALDDFGTGYSSLTHLKELPVGEVKVDRSFVATMGDDAADAAIVASTIALAQALQIRVVAEGVEDESTWSALAALGCDLIQGYAFSRPLPAGELAGLLARTPAER